MPPCGACTVLSLILCPDSKGLFKEKLMLKSTRNFLEGFREQPAVRNCERAINVTN